VRLTHRLLAVARPRKGDDRSARVTLQECSPPQVCTFCDAHKRLGQAALLRGLPLCGRREAACAGFGVGSTFKPRVPVSPPGQTRIGGSRLPVTAWSALAVKDAGRGRYTWIWREHASEPPWTTREALRSRSRARASRSRPSEEIAPASAVRPHLMRRRRPCRRTRRSMMSLS